MSHTVGFEKPFQYAALYLFCCSQRGWEIVRPTLTTLGEAEAVRTLLASDFVRNFPVRHKNKQFVLPAH